MSFTICDNCCIDNEKKIVVLTYAWANKNLRVGVTEKLLNFVIEGYAVKMGIQKESNIFFIAMAVANKISKLKQGQRHLVEMSNHI